MITQQQNRLCYHFDAETLWVEAWGPSGLRVRATREPAMPARNWALLPAPPRHKSPWTTRGPPSSTASCTAG